MALEYALFKTGPLTMPPSQLGAFARSDPASQPPTSNGTCSRCRSTSSAIRFTRFPRSRRACAICDRVSRGWVRITSPDPAVYPEIKLNYLREPEDRRIAVDAIRYTRRIMAAKALARFEPDEFRPGLAAQTDEELDESRGRAGHDDLSSGWNVQDGTRRDGRGRRPAVASAVSPPCESIDASIMPRESHRAIRMRQPT